MGSALVAAMTATRVAIVDRVVLHIPGPPQGKQRPRVNTRTRHAYTPAETLIAEQKVRDVWKAAGSPYLGDGAVNATVTCFFARPKAHLKADGSLSALGLREKWPKRCDVDNLGKLPLDALNGCAYDDDRQVCRVSFEKCWEVNGPCTVVRMHRVP